MAEKSIHWYGDGLLLSYYRADKLELVDSAVGTYPEEIEGYRATYNCPATLVGDLNTDYHSKTVTYLKNKDATEKGM